MLGPTKIFLSVDTLFIIVTLFNKIGLEQEEREDKRQPIRPFIPFLTTIDYYLQSIKFSNINNAAIIRSITLFLYAFFFFFLVLLFFYKIFPTVFFISMSLKQRIYGAFEPFDKLFYFCYNLVGKNLKKIFEIYEFTGYLKDLGKNSKMLKSPKSNGFVIINR